MSEKQYPSHFKDANQIGHMIHYLVKRETTNTLAQESLIQIEDAIVNARDVMFLHSDTIDKLVAGIATNESTHPNTTVECPITWTHHSYKEIVALLVLADELSTHSNRLREHDLIGKRDYYKQLKLGVRPIRGLFNIITALKRDYDLAYPE